MSDKGKTALRRILNEHRCGDPAYKVDVEHLGSELDRLQRAEELLRASRGFVADPNLHSVTGFTFVGTRQDCVQQIDAFLGESHD